MSTCVSLNCPFMLLCRHYNLDHERGERCVHQEEILNKAKKLMEEKAKEKGV